MKAVTTTAIIMILSLAFSVSPTQAQTTAFTYQGRLTSNSANANGSYDFIFALYDALTGGNQVIGVSAILRQGVTVTNGFFTVSLDFGAAVFPGTDRFLEILAKKSSDTSFTVLTPRQQISSNPYAIRAQSAASADNATQLGGVSSSQYVTTTNGPTNFIQNQSASTQTANFKISGNGTAGGALIASGSVSGAQFDIGANRVLGVGGTSNLFVGLSAGAANSSGTFNSFFGNGAGQKNTTGTANSFLGYQSGLNNLTGNNNLFAGTFAGTSNTSDNNTFVGAAAGQNNTSGNQNVFVGESAGLSNTTESSNTLIGFNARGGSGVTNSTAIGANARVTSSNSVVLGSLTDLNGNTTDTFVGIGVTSPLTKLHVVQNNSSIFRVIRAEGSSTLGVWSELVNTSTGGHDWAIISAGSSNSEGAGNLVITDQTMGGKVVINTPLSVPSCNGCTNSSSDRNVKSNFTPVDGRSVLERLVGIPIQSWNYNSDPKTIRHIGPMAQDFFAAFGLGQDDKHINLLDEGGIALAAIQELYKINQAKDRQINDLKTANTDLAKRLEALEKAVEKLTRQQQ